MKHACGVLGDVGLRFFGRISASISHELKNVLSIINESAGLLEDLSLMAEDVGSLDPLRVQKTTQRIQQQVSRADGIIQNMNCFSHSVDRARNAVDLHQLLLCLIAVTQRLSDMKGVKVAYDPPGVSILTTTSPFFLQALLWHLLEMAMDAVDEQKTIRIDAMKTQAPVGIQIRFSQLNDSADKAGDFPDAVQAALISVLDAEVTLGHNDIILTLPNNSSGIA